MAGTEPKSASDDPVPFFSWSRDPATSLSKKMKEVSASSLDRCIFIVPEKLRGGHEDAYSPRIVAIGPYHHNNERLKPMEDLKLRYLQTFLDHNKKFGLQDYIDRIKSWEDQVRKCYDRRILLDLNKFVEMVLLDSIFVIQLLVMHQNSRWRPPGDPIFGKPWMLSDVRRDMWLLENQIPFFAIQDLFEMAYGPQLEPMPGLLELACRFFWPAIKMEKLPEGLLDLEVKHFLDAIRLSHLPSGRKEPQECHEGLLHLPSLRKAPQESHEEFKFVPSATALVAAGVTLKRGKSQCLLDISFKNGELIVPCLPLYHSTESYFRNIIAFEQCYYQDDSYLINYMVFIDHLINTPDDAKLLSDKGIIENWLGSEKAATKLLNTLCNETTSYNETYVWTRNAYFDDLRHELIKHCDKHYNRWMATFRRDYCSSPWTVISVIAGVVLLVLTVAQTVCSFLSLDQYFFFNW